MKLKTLLVVMLMAAFTNAVADEGMWQLSQIKSLKLHKKGLKMDVEDIYNPNGIGLTDAILSMGGCSASFISEKGLIATNHHCAYGAISRNSTPEDNILVNGFLAESYAEEKKTEIKLTILYRYTDVTEAVLKTASMATSPQERYNAVDRKTKEMVLEAEKTPYTKARVASMNGGQQYILFVSKEIQDVRLVYNPPASIGKYGGDIDNWMWPRHTGDYSFLRAYVDKEGNPAPYSEDNVPYEPERYLKVSAKGIQEGDFNMIIGFPGRTMRYRTAYEVQNTLENNYKRMMKLMGGLIEILDAARDRDKNIYLKYAPITAGIKNYYKNTQGMIDGLTKSQLSKRKEAIEKELRQWINKDSNRKAKYGNPIADIDEIVKKNQEVAAKRTISGWLSRLSGVIGRAYSIVQWNEEKTKPEIERKRGYMSRDIPRLKRRIETMERGFVQEVDEEILEYMLNLAFDLPENQRIGSVSEFVKTRENIKPFVKALYANTNMTDKDTRMIYFEMDADELAKTADPAIEFANALLQESKQYDEIDETNAGKLQELRPNFIDALAKMQDKPLYPDANSTMRLTYGYVKGYSPGDAVKYNWYTSGKGVVEKYTGETPFDAPEKQIELLKKEEWGDYEDPEEETLMVNYLNTCDITGGNSGSAVLNAEGELVGLAFDGNYEAMTSDWQFTDEYSRTIVVDIRYALWVMKYMNNADNLLDEMDIVD